MRNNPISLSSQRLSTSARSFHSNNPNDFSRTRSSFVNSNNLNFARNTSWAFSKSNDPRPILNAKFKEDNINSIFDFLIQESYDKSITKKYLQNPSRNTFFDLFKFITYKILPDYNELQLSSINDEQVFSILSDLKYPGHINKNHWTAVGAPNTWNYLIAVLGWMTELATYWEYTDELMQEEEKNDNTTEAISEEDLLKKEFKDYINIAFNSTNWDNEREKLYKTFQLKTETIMKEEEQILLQEGEVWTEIQLLKETMPDCKELEDNYNIEIKSWNDDKTHQTQNIQLINDIKSELDKKKEIYEMKNKTVESIKKQIEELQLKINSQKTSPEQFANMQQMKINWDISYKSLLLSNEELKSKLMAIQNKINETKMKIIQSKINTKDKYQLDNIDLDNYINQLNSYTFNKDWLINDFNQINITLKEKIEKTKEEY
ncbi:MAG: hypothetical protein ACRC4L_02850, partial [Mycoplasma sp.]